LKFKYKYKHEHLPGEYTLIGTAFDLDSGDVKYLMKSNMDIGHHSAGAMFCIEIDHFKNSFIPSSEEV